MYRPLDSVFISCIAILGVLVLYGRDPNHESRLHWLEIRVHQNEQAQKCGGPFAVWGDVGIPLPGYNDRLGWGEAGYNDPVHGDVGSTRDFADAVRSLRLNDLLEEFPPKDFLGRWQRRDPVHFSGMHVLLKNRYLRDSTTH